MKPTITVKAANEIRVTGQGRIVRSCCSKCGHFLCETHLDQRIESNSLHYCPSCKSMCRVAISYTPRVY